MLVHLSIDARHFAASLQGLRQPDASKRVCLEFGSNSRRVQGRREYASRVTLEENPVEKFEMRSFEEGSARKDNVEEGVLCSQSMCVQADRRESPSLTVSVLVAWECGCLTYTANIIFLPDASVSCIVRSNAFGSCPRAGFSPNIPNNQPKLQDDEVQLKIHPDLLSTCFTI